MTHLKTLGIAAVAALGLIALVGAGTASATTLFTDSAKTIAYKVGQEIHWTLKTGASVVVTDTSNNVIATCTESTMKGEIEGSNTGPSVGGTIRTQTWGNCSQTTDNISLGSLSMSWTSGTSGTVVGKGSNVTLSIFGASCTYGTGEGTTLGTITGASAPELFINAPIPKTAGSFICPPTTVTQGKYIVTTPHALYVGA